MEVVVTSLEALIQRATNAALVHPEPAAIDAFCAIFADVLDGPLLATKVIAARIQSQNATESLLALEMLEKCMKRCGPSFHAEVGKFRFLNEMIKLVSPKYYADKTSPDVRLRVIQCLHKWTFDYPHETKFKVAFDMLKNQGVVKVSPYPLQDPPAAHITRPIRQGIFEDEEKSKMLQKLLQSRNADDIQAANRLIKNMVREEERRAEVSSRRAAEVTTALACARLLAELLQHARSAGADDRALMDELHMACRKHHSTLTATAKESNCDDIALGDILKASDELIQVFDKYKALIIDGNNPIRYEISTKDSHSEETTKSGAEQSSLLDLAIESAPATSTACQASSTVATLSDIFLGHTLGTVPTQMIQPLAMPLTQGDNLENMSKCISTLDGLGDELLKQSLSTSFTNNDTFNNKNSNAKKISMNALETNFKDVLLLDTGMTNSTNNKTLDLDYLIGKTMDAVKLTDTTVKPIENSDDLMVDITMDTNLLMDIGNTMSKTTASTLLRCDSSSENESGNSMLSAGVNGQSVPIPQNINEVDSSPIETNKTVKIDQKNKKNVEIKSLTDIHVSLQSITASRRAPVCMYTDENGVSVILHFCKDKPRADVWVMVITTTSKSSKEIDDFKFHAVVPKGCKVRLLPASGSLLPAHNPFLPPPAITQVLLLATPISTSKPQVCLKFVLTYDLRDESVSEIGEIKLQLDDE